MSYALTVGNLHFLPLGVVTLEEPCSCTQAKSLCSPAYVYSMGGQVGFRSALAHLTSCSTRDCRSLRAKVTHGMVTKLRWLMAEESLLGCVLVQPYLFGTRRVVLERRHFPVVAHHLANCPKESCAQLRRALLLTVREKVRPFIPPQH